MNMFGFTHFNRLAVADPLQRITGRRVELGRMNWQADSYHLYGKDQKDFRARFQDRLASSSFDDRVFRFFDEPIQEIWREAGEAVQRKIDSYDGSSTR